MRFLEKASVPFIGFLQATGVIAYCGLVALFFYFMSKTSIEPPGFFGFFLMLNLLVISAAVCGSLVFGYPTYLFFTKNQIRRSLSILAYTLAFIFGIIVLTSAVIVGLN